MIKPLAIKLNKIRLNDGTEIVIEPGASLPHVEITLASHAELDGVSKSLKKEGNLDKVQFLTGDEVTGEYTYMIWESQAFKVVQDNDDGTVSALFGLSNMDPTQKKMLEMEKKAEEQQKQIDELNKLIQQLLNAGKE